MLRLNISTWGKSSYFILLRFIERGRGTSRRKSSFLMNTSFGMQQHTKRKLYYYIILYYFIQTLQTTSTSLIYHARLLQCSTNTN